MDNFVYYVAAFALVLFIYFRYMHRDMMNLVDVARTVSERKKQQPEKDQMDLMEDALVELDMDNLVKMAEGFVGKIPEGEDPLDVLGTILRFTPEEPEEDEE